MDEATHDYLPLPCCLLSERHKMRLAFRAPLEMLRGDGNHGQWLGMFYVPWLPKEHIPCVGRRSSKRESSIPDALLILGCHFVTYFSDV